MEAEYEYEWQYLPVYVGGSSEAVWELEALDPPWRAGPATQDRGSIPPSAFTRQEKANDTGHRTWERGVIPLYAFTIHPREGQLCVWK